MNAAWLTHPHSRPTNHLPPPSQWWPLRKRQLATQDLLASHSALLPFAFIPSSFCLPETQMWCLEAQGPSCDVRTKDTVMDGETETWTVVLHALFEHTAVATDCFPLDFLNWKKSSPDRLSLYQADFLLFAAIYLPKWYIPETKYWKNWRQSYPYWSSATLCIEKSGESTERNYN